ncbi:hypothetical protein SDC9_155917 [bioreactor metagenome]|uniref:Uncharacterized protein n=1 Tax=bioreactor metagenome TaxID=1076179 RepID=A0A645F543_9ZZZZ
MLGGQPVKTDGLRRIPCHTIPIFVAIAQKELRLRELLLRGLFKPLYRKRLIFFDAHPMVVHHPQLILCRGVPRLCRKLVQPQCLVQIFWQPVTHLVQFA